MRIHSVGLLPSLMMVRALAFCPLLLSCQHNSGAPVASKPPVLAKPLPPRMEQLANVPFFVPMQVQPDMSTASAFSGRDGESHLVVGGVRVLRDGNTSRVAEKRLPKGVLAVMEGPKHLGGGYFFWAPGALYRSENWLSDYKLLAELPASTQGVLFGTQSLVINGATLTALDPQTGAKVKATGLPPAPKLAGLVAFDENRATALADGLGLVATRDGGKTWDRVRTPIRFDTLVNRGGHAIVAGMDLAASAPLSMEVTADGNLMPARSPTARESARSAETANFRDAVEIGWPLEDGRVLFLRDGDLQIFDLRSGALDTLETNVTSASRCAPLPLLRDTALTVGFVCAEASAKTTMFAYDGKRGRLTRVFDLEGPRALQPSSRGLFAMRGDCLTGTNPKRTCVYGADEKLRDLDIQGDAQEPRVVPLASGAMALVSPPNGNMQSARITLVEKGVAKTLAMQFPPLRSDTHRILERGVWLQGFEERASGTVGGWVELSGLVLGVEIARSGEVKVGTLLADAGTSTVAGRFGMHWSSTLRGFQSVDGGMTWKQLELPDPVSQRAMGRACSPVGTLGDGWIRIGWGETKTEAPRISTQAPPSVASAALVCDLVQRGDVPQATDQNVAFMDGDFPRARRPTRFHGGRLPVMRPDATVVAADIYGLSRTDLLGQLAAWVPKEGDWATQGMLFVQWLSPYEDSGKVRATAAMRLPVALKDIVAQRGPMAQIVGDARIAIAEDSERALLSSRSWSRRDRRLFALSRGQVAQEVTREDGGLFDDVDASTFHEGRWHLTTTEPEGAKLFVVDAGIARLVTTVPRAGTPPAMSYLVRNVVDGGVQIALDGWVFSNDQRQPPVFVGSPSTLRLCQNETEGYPYRAEQALAYNIEVRDARGELRGTTHTVSARLRMAPNESPCIERLAGSFDSDLSTWTATAPLSSAVRKDGITLVGTASGARRSLRCTMR